MTAIDRAAGTFMDDASYFLLLSIAVMASAWFAGTGAALTATLLGAILGATETRDTVEAAGPRAAHLAVFLVQGLLITGVLSELRAARRAAEREARASEAARKDGDAANRMKDEFLAAVSHELRTPLNAVLGWVHLLRTGKLDPSAASRGLESIERNVRLQAQVTTDLLDVSKALTGRLQIDCKPASLTDAVRQRRRREATISSCRCWPACTAICPNLSSPRC